MRGFTQSPENGITPRRVSAMPFFGAGLTLVELLVVISISTVIASLLLADFGQFNARFNLSTAAQEFALALRKAQVFASGVRQEGGIFPGYGVHVDGANPNIIIVFADTDISANGRYDGDDIVIQRITLENGNYISDICIEPPSLCGRTSLDIVFLRPEPSITISSGGLSGITNARVILAGPKPGIVKSVRTWITGQISIEQ